MKRAVNHLLTLLATGMVLAQPCGMLLASHTGRSLPGLAEVESTTTSTSEFEYGLSTSTAYVIVSTPLVLLSWLIGTILLMVLLYGNHDCSRVMLACTIVICGFTFFMPIPLIVTATPLLVGIIIHRAYIVAKGPPALPPMS